MNDEKKCRIDRASDKYRNQVVSKLNVSRLDDSYIETFRPSPGGPKAYIIEFPASRDSEALSAAPGPSFALRAVLTWTNRRV
jgi:hypothetical protein